MEDIERIELIIKDIEVYNEKLNNLNISSEKELEDDRNYFSASMLIFNIVNRIIDLAEEIVSQKHLVVAFKYIELFDSLEMVKLISKDISKKCKDLISLRNKISHRYGKVTKKEILDAINKVKISIQFIKEIEKGMKNEKSI